MLRLALHSSKILRSIRKGSCPIQLFSSTSGTVRAEHGLFTQKISRRTELKKFDFPRGAKFISSTKDTAMFCFQCEQTEGGKGCTTIGICGKTPETATLQDLLIHELKGISFYANRARQLGVSDNSINVFTLQALFSTLTNVNFDSARFVEYIKEAEQYFLKAKKMYEDACKKAGKTPLKGPDSDYTFGGKHSLEELETRGKQVGIQGRKAKSGDDIVGLQELIVYGVKGLAAYADHAEVLGKKNEEVFAFIHKAMDKIGHENLSLSELLSLALEVGATNYKVMEMLEHAETSAYGHPSPTQVRVTGVQGKGILVSGHDLKDVHDILQQTEGLGINVYTHGELLPAHGYPELRKYKHLAGNYGGAWQMQKLDFAAFPGPVVMTSNCIIEPKTSYKDRIFTRSVVGWPGVKHVKNNDFSEVIKAAQQAKGFLKDETPRYITVGFGKNAVLGLAGTVVDAIQKGDIKHFFFIGGCDGSEGERNYFKELALSTPKDSVILTAGCGKYRFNKYNFGTTGLGIPRLLDVGQCNDSYGAIQIALGLAKALNTEVNKLPLSFAVSWFEQKAVAVLLTLLHLNIQNIHLGPNLPGFATPNMLKILQDKFQLKTIDLNVVKDLQTMMAGR